MLTCLVICSIQKIAIELIVESGGGTKSYFLQNACSTPATDEVNSYNLTLGLEEYVSKHGNKLTDACHSCFSTGSVLMIKSSISSYNWTWDVSALKGETDWDIERE